MNGPCFGIERLRPLQSTRTPNGDEFVSDVGTATMAGSVTMATEASRRRRRRDKATVHTSENVRAPKSSAGVSGMSVCGVLALRDQGSKGFAS